MNVDNKKIDFNAMVLLSDKRTKVYVNGNNKNNKNRLYLSINEKKFSNWNFFKSVLIQANTDKKLLIN